MLIVKNFVPIRNLTLTVCGSSTVNSCGFETKHRLDIPFKVHLAS